MWKDRNLPYVKFRTQLAVVAGWVILCLVGIILICPCEMEQEHQRESLLIYDHIRLFNERVGPMTPTYAFVGSFKTKLYHRFTSACALEIGKFDLDGFETQDQAEKCEYEPCPVCFDQVAD